MEETLEQLMKTPESLLESLNHPIFKQLTLSPIGVLDIAGEFIYFNQAAEKITGYSEKEITGVNILAFLSPSAREVANPYYKTMKPGLLAEHAVIEWVKRDGGSCYIEWKTTTLYDKNRSPEYYFIIGEDVTDHRQNMLDIKHTNQQYRDIVLGSSDFIWHLNSKQEFSYCSPGVTILGYNAKELLGKSLPGFPPQKEKNKPASEQSTTANAQETTIHSEKHKQGHVITFDTSFSTVRDQLGKLKGYRGISRDITEHNKLLLELNKSERRHQHSQKASNFGIWEWNLDTGELYWSDQVWPVFGLDKAIDQPSLEIFMNCIHPDDRERMTNTIQKSAETGQQFEIEYRIVWPDDSLHWIKSTGNVIGRENGLTMAGLAIDIDEKKTTVQKLSALEYSYQQLFQYSDDALFISDRHGVIINTNRSLNLLLKYNKSSLHGKSLAELCIHCCPDCHAISDKVPLLHDKMTVCNTGIQQSNGNVIPVEIKRSAIETNNKLFVQASIRDLRPQLQKELERKKEFEQQRLALIREIHHRIKNNLQGIIGLLRYHQGNEPLDPEKIIAKAISQLHSISLIYGMQGRAGEDNVTLESLVETISQNQIKTEDDIVKVNLEFQHSISITSTNIIPFCLILNELIVNALKHKVSSENNNVSVSYQSKDKKAASICIVTPGAKLPCHFNFSEKQGLGTGLGLISSLMPPQGMKIQYKQINNNVETLLTLSSPVIHAR